MTQLHAITQDRIDPDALKVIRRLSRSGHEAYLVGGCVRDLLLGLCPKDFDVATSATPSEIRALFRNSRIVGRRFRLAHIFFGKHIIETATFRMMPTAADSDPQIWHDNEFGTLESDARRRDFTINGLYYDVNTGEVIDTVNGLGDLRTRLIRTIGDPELRFPEDPVRIIRATKFSVRLNMAIEEDTRAAMIHHRGRLAKCSVARVLEEIYRLLRGGHACPAFRQLHEVGVLAVLLPEIATMLPPPSDLGAQLPAPVVRAGLSRRPKRSGEKRAEIEPSNMAPSADPEDQDTDVTDALSVASIETATHDPLLPEEQNGLAAIDTDTALNPQRVVRERAKVDRLLAHLGYKQADINDDLLQAVESQLWTHLTALDKRHQQPQPETTEPILMGLVLIPIAMHALSENQRFSESADKLDRLVSELATRLQMPRRQRERLKKILIAQRRLVQRSPRRGIRHRDYFREALTLLELRHEATGDFVEPVARWREASAGDPPPRSRRRRRRRRRSASN